MITREIQALKTFEIEIDVAMRTAKKKAMEEISKIIPKKKLEMKLETGKNGVSEASINIILVTKLRGGKGACC